MSRPSPLPRLIILACAAILPAGCKTVYTEMYSPRGNHYHPPVEKKVELPVDKKANANAPQGLPAAGAAPAGGGIPGLAPVPGLGDLPGMGAPAAPAPGLPAPAP